MQILARYIAGIFLKNLGLGLMGLTALFFFQNLITQLNDYPFGQLFVFVLYDIPQLMVMVIPPATLLATIMTFSSLSRTSELVAIQSIGIGVKQLMSVILPLVFVLGCISLIIQDRFLPVFHEGKTLFYWRTIKKRQDFYLDVGQEKIWYRSGNLIYNIRTFDPKLNRLIGLSAYMLDDLFNLNGVIQAEEALYQDSKWVVPKAKEVKFDKDTGFPETESTIDTTVPILEGPEEFKMIEREVDRLRIKELIKFIGVNKASGIDTKGYEVKLHSRFSLSFIPLIMALLALPFSVSHFRSGSAGRDIGIASGLTLVYWIVFTLGLSMGRAGTLPPVLGAWLPTIGFGLLAVFFIRRMEHGKT